MPKRPKTVDFGFFVLIFDNIGFYGLLKSGGNFLGRFRFLRVGITRHRHYAGTS